MILLYNHTALADAPLRAVLSHAARVMGVKGHVAVKVTQGRRGACSGAAYHGYPYVGFLNGLPHAKRRGTDRLLDCPDGWVAMVVPSLALAAGRKSELDAAENVYHVALHEMAHILAFREGTDPRTPRTPSGRRITHDRRPCEIQAENLVYDVRKRVSGSRQETLIIGLALDYERAGRHGRRAKTTPRSLPLVGSLPWGRRAVREALAQDGPFIHGQLQTIIGTVYSRARLRHKWGVSDRLIAEFGLEARYGIRPVG